MTYDGQTIRGHTQPVTIPARESHRFEVPDDMHQRRDTLLVAECGGQRAWWFFERDKDMDYPAPAFDAEVCRAKDGVCLTITARVLLRDLTIYPDRLDPEAIIDAQVVTLLPGESQAFHITTARELKLEDLTTRPVMQLANHYGKGGST